MLKHWTIQLMKTEDYYFDLDSNECVEQNTSIEPTYVVRYDSAEDPEYPCYEDQSYFDTLEAAQEYLNRVEIGERERKRNEATNSKTD